MHRQEGSGVRSSPSYSDNADGLLGAWDSCAAAKLAEQIMLTEERSLTAIKICVCITLHSRIFDITTKAENGEALLMFSRPSTFSGAAEMESLPWSPVEISMVDWVCVRSDFASPCLTYDSHLIRLYAD
jgi:hypothetical protein